MTGKIAIACQGGGSQTAFTAGVLKAFFEGTAPAERVAQRLLQTLGDPLLGWTTIDGRAYYICQMKNMKASMPVAFLTGAPVDFWAFACGSILARAHARVGDAAYISGYCGQSAALARVLAEFAENYGDQTERDHDELVRAIKAGRVEAQQEAS